MAIEPLELSTDVPEHAFLEVSSQFLLKIWCVMMMIYGGLVMNTMMEYQKIFCYMNSLMGFSMSL